VQREEYLQQVDRLTVSLEQAREGHVLAGQQYEKTVRSLKSEKLRLEGKCAELYGVHARSAEESERKLHQLEQSLNSARDALQKREADWHKEREHLVAESEQKNECLQQRMDTKHMRMLEHEHLLNQQFKDQNQQWRGICRLCVYERGCVCMYICHVS
jgi:hypothetical protein